MPLIAPAIALSTRQEAFCRRYTVSGNADDDEDRTDDEDIAPGHDTT